MEKLEENLTKCKKILEEWSKTKHLQEMLRLYEQLTLYAVFIGENLSELKKDYNQAYFVRKIEVSHSFLTNRREKISESTSLKQAENDNEELIRRELEAESLTYRLDVFLKQINKTLEMMRSKIAYERSEKDRISLNDIT